MMTSSHVTPVEHPRSEVLSAIYRGDFDGPLAKESIAYLATAGRWKDLWDIADSMSREVSILFDSNMMVWVDVGTRGEVSLEPPIGATIPFRLWIHTHPLDAYWSSTDLRTLASYSSILSDALVLGHDHCKKSSRPIPGQDLLGAEGPLSQWTSEPCKMYSEMEITPTPEVY